MYHFVISKRKDSFIVNNTKTKHACLGYKNSWTDFSTFSFVVCNEVEKAEMKKKRRRQRELSWAGTAQENLISLYCEKYLLEEIFLSFSRCHRERATNQWVNFSTWLQLMREWERERRMSRILRIERLEAFIQHTKLQNKKKIKK